MVSIITTYYNQYELLKELADVLIPQLTNQVEWIIVDDGCNEKRLDSLNATVYHLFNNSGGPSHPRNVGLSMARGEYILFIDGDDLVSNDYMSAILNKIKEEDFDFCFFGWKSFGRSEYTVCIKDNPPSWNCSVWNCIYKKDLIKEVKFDVFLKIAEDYKFNAMVRKGRKSNIDKVLYYYRVR